MKSAPVLRLWMNSRVGKSIVWSVDARSWAWPAIIPSRPMARASAAAIAVRAAASGPSGQPWARSSKARLRRAKAARMALASPWSLWAVGCPRLSRGVVHAGKVVEDEARGVHHLDGAGRGQDRFRVAAQDVGHEQGQDRPQALGGSEEARLDRGRHRRGRARRLEPPQHRLDLAVPLRERPLEGLELGDHRLRHGGDR